MSRRRLRQAAEYRRPSCSGQGVVLPAPGRLRPSSFRKHGSHTESRRTGCAALRQNTPACRHPAAGRLTRHSGTTSPGSTNACPGNPPAGSVPRQSGWTQPRCRHRKCDQSDGMPCVRSGKPWGMFRLKRFALQTIQSVVSRNHRSVFAHFWPGGTVLTPRVLLFSMATVANGQTICTSCPARGLSTFFSRTFTAQTRKAGSVLQRFRPVQTKMVPKGRLELPRRNLH